MKRSVFLFVLLACMFVSAHAVKSQTVSRPTSEQSLQELVAEVRQLRATLLRMNVALYKGQVMLERLKLQQEQVTRMSSELAGVRDEIGELKAVQEKIRQQMRTTRESIEAGIRDSGALTELKAELERLRQREQRLQEREMQLENELAVERAKLNELNDRLNALVEIEMAPK